MQSPEKIVGCMFKYAVFKIQKHYNRYFLSQIFSYSPKFLGVEWETPVTGDGACPLCPSLRTTPDCDLYKRLS